MVVIAAGERWNDALRPIAARSNPSTPRNKIERAIEIGPLDEHDRCASGNGLVIYLRACSIQSG